MTFKDGTVLNRPRDRPGVHSVSKRLTSDAPQSAGYWFGSGIVMLCAIFLLLTLNEGNPSEYQRALDFVFHSWPLMAAATVGLWAARRGRFGNLPMPLRAIATILLPFFCLFTFFALINSPLTWMILGPLGVSRSQATSIATLIAVGLFVVGGGWLFIRGLFGWISERYQSHGVAVGLGPVYFYFRKRRSR